MYANNRASGLLRTDHPVSLAPLVDFNGDDLFFGMTKVGFLSFTAPAFRHHLSGNGGWRVPGGAPAGQRALRLSLMHACHYRPGRPSCRAAPPCAV